MGSSPRPPVYDAFSPPPAPGQADAFSPPPAPAPGEVDAFSPPPAPRQADAFSPPPPPPPRPQHPPLGREVVDTELFAPRAVPSRFPRLRSAPAPTPTPTRTPTPAPARRTMSEAKPQRAGAAREVLDDELFGDNSSPPPPPPPPPPPSLGREVDDNELFNRGSTKSGRKHKGPQRKSRPSNRTTTTTASASASRETQGQAQTRGGDDDGTNAPTPKRHRRMAKWEARRAELAASGVVITVRTLADNGAAYEALPWRVGREVGDYMHMGPVRRLSEVCLEAVRRQVRSGFVRDLRMLPDDFVYEVLASGDVDAAVLMRVEADNPHLAPVVETAWARVCNSSAEAESEHRCTTLPQRFPSWRHLYEHRQHEMRRRMENASQRVRASYQREAGAVRSMQLSGAMPPPTTRRRRANSPTEPLTTLARLRQAHRRAMNRPVSRR